MDTKRTVLGVFVLGLVLLGPAVESRGDPLGTAFTYQGQLKEAGTPADGPYDFAFLLYNDSEFGHQVGDSFFVEDADVLAGLFTVRIDFGDVFDGTALWLEIRVRPGDSGGSYTPLWPRQELTAVPYALYALQAPPGEYWSLAGNSGTDPAIHFLGTTDDQPLIVKVNAARALRIEPHTTSPNLVGGYEDNSVAIGVYGAAIGGGGLASYEHSVSGNFGVIAGGRNNTVSGERATIGGGYRNTASGWGAVIAGGEANTASGQESTIGGGYDNIAAGLLSMIPGGERNETGDDYSFAAGREAKAMHKGCFVWGDSTPAETSSSTNNEWTVQASGGYRFYTDNSHSTGAQLPSGSGSWSSMSDRNVKRNFSPVDPRQVLKKLVDVSIERWNYESQDPSIQHIGPMAQDFYGTFGVGEDDRHISMIDADGVALAAIQGLHEIVKEKDTEIGTLRESNERLEARLSALEALVAELAANKDGGAQ